MEFLRGENGAEVIYSEHRREKGKFMFYCDGSVEGYIVDEHDEDSYDNAWDEMVENLRTVLPNDEAIILTVVGVSGDMQYVTAYSRIITTKTTAWVNLIECALVTTKELLGNPDYDTQIDY